MSANPVMTQPNIITTPQPRHVSPLGVALKSRRVLRQRVRVFYSDSLKKEPVWTLQIECLTVRITHNQQKHLVSIVV